MEYPRGNKDRIYPKQDADISLKPLILPVLVLGVLVMFGFYIGHEVLAIEVIQL